MKRNRLSKSFFYIALIITYLVIIIIMFSFFNNTSSRNTISVEYQTERTAFTLLELFRQNELPGTLETVENLRGFGIYKPDGIKIFAWGSAPESLDPGVFSTRNPFRGMPARNTSFSYNTNRQSLDLTLRISHMTERIMPMRRMMHLDQESPGFIFLEQDVPGYWQSRRSLHSARVIMPILLLLIMGVIVFLYKKNRDYKVRLASHTELVKLGEISRTLSHEIKNPLSAIRIQTGILKKTIPWDRQQELKIIEEEVERLGILTRRIADFLRDPAGKPEKVHLQDFIRELIKRFQFKIEFTNSLTGDAVILFDRDRLRSVLENIIKNGIESYPGDQQGIIEIRLLQEKQQPVVSVMDRGAGIAPELREKVFETADSGKLAGYGIGLAIAQRFMEAMGGTISILSREGGGTEVRIIFREQ